LNVILNFTFDINVFSISKNVSETKEKPKFCEIFFKTCAVLKSIISPQINKISEGFVFEFWSLKTFDIFSHLDFRKKLLYLK